LTCGLITVFSVPIIWRTVDADVSSARFLDEDDKLKVIERLRANNTGTGSNEYKWRQAVEMLMDPKSHLFFALTFMINVGAAVTNAFGPTLIANFGFDSYTTTLLNIPFGVLQMVVILASSYAAQRSGYKSAALVAFMLPVLAGTIILYVEASASTFRQAPALVRYYLLAFIFAGNPLLVSMTIVCG
jgi:predicted MFS family arabinose efflux permease